MVVPRAPENRPSHKKIQGDEQEIKDKANEKTAESEQHLERHETLARGVTLFQVDIARRAAMLALTDMSLVKHEPFEDGTHAVTVHRVVQMVARSLTEKSGTARTMTDLIMRQLYEIYPSDKFEEPDRLRLCEQLMPHLFVWRCTLDAKEAITSQTAHLLARAVATIVSTARPSLEEIENYRLFIATVRPILSGARPDAKVLALMFAAVEMNLELFGDDLPSLLGNSEIIQLMKETRQQPALMGTIVTAFQNGRLPRHRELRSVLEVVLDLLEEISGVVPVDTKKIIRSMAYVLESQWQSIEGLIAWLEKRLGLR